MRKHLGSLITVGENGGQDEDFIAFDSYETSSAADGRLMKLTFVNGVSQEEDEDDVPMTEIVIAQHAFISFAVTDIPTVTITKAEYDSLKETVEILGSPEAMRDIQEAIIETAVQAIMKGDLVPDEIQEAAEKAAEKARERLADEKRIQALADEAEAGYDPNGLIPRIHPNAMGPDAKAS